MATPGAPSRERRWPRSGDDCDSHREGGAARPGPEL